MSFQEELETSDYLMQAIIDEESRFLIRKSYPIINTSSAGGDKVAFRG